MNRQAIFSCLIIACCGFAQDPSWDDDITVYGTSANESRPVITALSQEDDTLRVFCVQDGFAVCNRVSLNNGLTWEPFEAMSEASDSHFVAATSNGEYTHAVVFQRNSAGLMPLFSFSETATNWNNPVQIPLNVFSTVFDAALISDILFAPADPFLNICWMESQQDFVNLLFCQSHDHGLTLTPAEFVQNEQINATDPVSLTLAASWIGDEEKLWIAYSADRDGSIGNSVRIVHSTSQGDNWSFPVTMDSSSYPQIDPSIAAFQQTILLTYSRRTGAPTQKDIFLSFSLDNGEHFSLPTPITGGLTDEFHPQVVITPDGNSFAIFYLSGQALEEPCTVLMRSGSLETPWDLSEVQQVSETDGALRSGGVSAVATENGFAAVWSSPHALGDADILFDGSWRGVAVEERPMISVVQSFMLPAYPNPFNSTTTIPLMIRNDSEIELTVSDILGRSIMTKQFGSLSAGRNDIQMNFAGIPSGTYWILSASLPGQIVQVKLIK